ncbi:MAG: nucleoid-associated protein [Christensenellales bacterium]|jgi:hypothetical protein
MQITIHQAILHILDPQAGEPVLSCAPLDLRGSACEYLRAHLEKVAGSDGLKPCVFGHSAGFLSYLPDLDIRFVENSQKIARKLFDLMGRYPAIQPGDVALLRADIDGQDVLALLKFNYKPCFTHQVTQQGEGLQATVAAAGGVLPTPSQRVEEAALVDLAEVTVSVLEKPVALDDEKGCYLSGLLLGASPKPSQREKLSTLKKAVEKVDADFSAAGKGSMQRLASVVLDEEAPPTLEKIGQRLYPNQPQAQQAFVEKIQAEELAPEDTLVLSEQTAKRIEKQSIKTATGIEVKIPVALYEQPDAVEFITNPDGTLSLLVKNVVL